MKKRNLLIAFLMMIFICKITNAQVTFQKTYGSANADNGNFTQQTSDGGYIIAGSASDFILGSNNDAYLIKTDINGNMLWSKTYGNTYDEFANCVQQTTDGGYIIAGLSSFGGPTSRGFLIKTNTTGDTIWTKTYGNEIVTLYTVRQTSDGGYIAGGHTSGTFGFAALLKVDNAGDVLWSKKYGNGLSADDLIYVSEVQQTTDGGYIAVGNRGCGNCPIFLLKLNSAGDTLWSKIYDPYLFSGNSVQQTQDGGYIIGGMYHQGSVNDGAAFIKTDANGNIVWYKVYSMSNWGELKYLRQTINGEYIALLEGDDNLALKINASGNFIWCEKYQLTGANQYQCIQQTNDLGFVITGTGPQSNSNVIFIKTDSNGISGCNEVPFLISATSPSITVQSAMCPITTLSIITSSLSPIYVNNPATTETTLCTTVGISQLSNNAENVSIYPNPVQDRLTILTQQNKSSAFIKIYNNRGEIVKEEQLKMALTTITLSNLSDGLYLYQISDMSGNILDTGKFIKE